MFFYLRPCRSSQNDRRQSRDRVVRQSSQIYPRTDSIDGLFRFGPKMTQRFACGQSIGRVGKGLDAGGDLLLYMEGDVVLEGIIIYPRG